MTSIFIIWAFFFTACEKNVENTEVQPTNLSLKVDISGYSDLNPYGDGSGLITMTATAENAKVYKFLIGSDIIESTSGSIQYTCSKKGKNEYNIFVSAYNKDKFISAEKKITVYVAGKLVWSDEFDTPNIDKTKWEHEVNGDGGGNNELQFYTDSDKNSFVQNGKLFIKAIHEKYQNKDFTSARLRTKLKGDWLYGKVEVKAKVPTGLGTWPAIWMLPTDWAYGGWPQSGEIDIMEHVGYDPNVIHGSIHTDAYNHVKGTQKSSSQKVPDATTEFHVYAIEWYEDRIDFYIDNNKYFSFANENKGWATWPFDKRFHLILNLAVGGNWGGAKGVNPDHFPAQMEIDYVRVYN
ncbi:MAG: family 16 glycosylhydrolase [Deltaproteobacteria bacterium]